MHIRLFTFCVFLVFAHATAFGQLYKSLLPSPEFSNALEKVILDFKDDYKTIQGPLLDKQGETETYESSIKLPGINDCKILRFHSVEDTTASWQGIAYSGDDYKEAIKAYQNTFRLVKKSNIHWIDRSSISFAGEIQNPRDDVRFTTSTLTLKLDDNRYDKFQAEVELLSTYSGWQVQLNLGKKTRLMN